MKLHGLAPLATDLHLRNQNAAGRSLLPRSTNIAKGWHRGFNSMLGCLNPTIWEFLDCVKAEQSLTDMKKKTKEIIKERP